MKVEHWEARSYFDYWRFTEFTLNRLMHNNGFQILYLSSNHNPVYPIYFFVIASRCPEIWKGKFAGYDDKALIKMHTKYRNVDPVVSIMM